MPEWAAAMRVLAGETIASEPDLSLVLPRRSAEPGGIPAWFVDTLEKRGEVLARFDSVIFNSGGALDLYTGNAGKTVHQVVWPGGRPPADDLPNPTEAPRDRNNQRNLTPAGAEMKYVRKVGHNHFHFQRAARYQLVLSNGTVRESAKVGFCMLDSWGGDGTASYFNISTKRNYCQHGNPDAVFTRMGISPGIGDYYNAQLADQWVEVTGVRPGRHRLRGTVNANGVLIESDLSNNAIGARRIIPGAIARPPASRVRTRKRVVIRVRGRVVGANVPSRKNRACDLFTKECYETAAPGRLDFRIGRRPRHGTVNILTEKGLTARIRYRPDPGFRGADSFRFTVTDSRGLRSRPATVQLRVR